MTRRPRIIYWDNIPAPYAVERFNALAARGTIDFSAWFARRRDDDRSWSVNESAWKFPGAYVESPAASLDAAAAFAHRIADAQPDLVVSFYGEPGFFVGHAICKAMDVRTALRVLPTFDAWVNRSRLRETAKALLFRSADGVKVPGPDGEAYARRYGMPAWRISRVTQSIDADRYARPRDTALAQTLRKQLGNRCVFLYAGRMWRGKGLHVLLDAFRELSATRSDTALVLVGDGPDAAEFRREAAGIRGVSFVPFVEAEDLAAYYAAANVFVFPTLGDPHGLVVDEAHAAGLPVISTTAAGDIARRITHGENGYLVPPGDATQLAARMRTLAGDAGLRRVMGARGFMRLQGMAHAAWASDFERFVEVTLSTRPRRSPAAAALVASGSLLLAAASVRRRYHARTAGAAT